MPQVLDPITGRMVTLPYPGESPSPAPSSTPQIGAGGRVIPAQTLRPPSAPAPQTLGSVAPSVGGRGDTRVAVGMTPEEARAERARDPEAQREVRRLTKREEAQAAIASMKVKEGRPLTEDEQFAWQKWNEAGALRGLAAQRSVVKKRNPLYQETKQHIGQTREAQGQVLSGQVGQYEAQLQSARDIEAFQARVTLEDQMVQAGLQAKETFRQQSIDEAIQATKESQRLVQEAAEKFNRTPTIDPNRLWANKTAGQKFGAAILSIVGARAGAVLPGSFQAIQQAIQDDIQAQKDNIALGQAKFGALSEAFQSQTQAYSAIRAAVDDERTADLIYERSRIEQAEREFQWWMQKGQVAQMSAGQQTFLGQIQQAKADLDLQLAQRAQANPKVFKRVVRNPNAKALIARADKLEDFTMETLKGEREQRGKMEIERLKAGDGGGMTEGDKTRSWDQRKWIAEKTAPKRLELEAIRKFQEEYKDDIPSVSVGGKFGRTVGGAAAGFTTGFVPGAIIGGIFGANSSELTAEQRDAKAKLQRIVYLRLRPESGAAIPDSEVEKDAAQIVDSWSSEDDVRRWLANRGEEATSFIDYYERAPDLGEVEQYRRANVQDPRSLTEQQGVADPTQVDEDAIPYSNPY